jgi:hypothetical protein
MTIFASTRASGCPTAQVVPEWPGSSAHCGQPELLRGDEALQSIEGA